MERALGNFVDAEVDLKRLLNGISRSGKNDPAACFMAFDNSQAMLVSKLLHRVHVLRIRAVYSPVILAAPERTPAAIAMRNGRIAAAAAKHDGHSHLVGMLNRADVFCSCNRFPVATGDRNVLGLTHFLNLLNPYRRFRRKAVAFLAELLSICEMPCAILGPGKTFRTA
jgi:hypothetical protein